MTQIQTYSLDEDNSEFVNKEINKKRKDLRIMSKFINEAVRRFISDPNGFKKWIKYYDDEYARRTKSKRG